MIDVIKFDNTIELKKEISEIALNKNVFKELGYPIFTDDNHKWFLIYYKSQLIGFCSCIIKKNNISFNHDYIIPNFRNKGYYNYAFKIRFDCFKNNKIKSVCTHKSLNTFLKYGFEIKKQTKNYFFVEYLPIK